MGRCGDSGHVVQRTAAIVHLREQEHGHVVAQAAEGLPLLHEFELHAVLRGERLGHIEIGRKIFPLGNDDAALRRIGAGDGQRGAEHFVQIDGGGVGHHQFVGRGAHEAGDLVAHASGQIDPARRVPAANQAFAPFLGEHGLHPRGGCPGQGAERIAVEVDDAVGQGELLAQRGEGIGGVEREAVLAL